jgi:hypothetical protein
MSLVAHSGTTLASTAHTLALLSTVCAGHGTSHENDVRCTRSTPPPLPKAQVPGAVACYRRLSQVVAGVCQEDEAAGCWHRGGYEDCIDVVCCLSG